MEKDQIVSSIVHDSVLVEICNCSNGNDDGEYRTISPLILDGVIPVSEVQDLASSQWVAQSSFCRSEIGSVAEVGNSILANYPMDSELLNSSHGWLENNGINSQSGEIEAMPLICSGAKFHHDAGFSNCVFAVVWLSDALPCDLVFPQLGKSIELKKGVIVVFDSCQPHGVAARKSDNFSPSYFENHANLPFVSFEIPLNESISELLKIKYQYSDVGWNGYILRRQAFEDQVNDLCGQWTY